MKKILLFPLLLVTCFCLAQDAKEIIGKPITIGNLVVAQNDFPKLIKEDMYAIFVGMIVIGLAHWIMKSLGIRWGHDTGLSGRVKDSFGDIYKDKELVKDLANILNQEGDLDKLFDKIYKDDSPEWDDIEMVKSYKFQPDAKRIASKLVKTSSYKRFSNKHQFDKTDDIKMENIFYFIITQKNFKDTAKNYILNAVTNSSNLINKGRSPQSLKLSDLIPNFVG